MLNYNINKRAQAGEALTWVVATIIIIAILIIFTFISSLFAQKNGAIVTINRVFGGEDLKDVDWIGVKNNLAFEKDPNSRGSIENWIKGVEK